jgi:hypothetical protein
MRTTMTRVIYLLAFLGLNCDAFLAPARFSPSAVTQLPQLSLKYRRVRQHQQTYQHMAKQDVQEGGDVSSCKHCVSF